MVSRSSSLGRVHALESETAKIKFFDKYIDHTNRIILSHVVVQKFREQCPLSTIFAFDKALHLEPQ